MQTKYILCFSGGKDSTAMLIYVLENNLPLDEILYIDVGDWMWEEGASHLEKVKEKFKVDITVLDVTDELKKGFERWGFPGFLNRWCTGVKRIAMRDYLREKYGKDARIIQYIGYCADEVKRSKTKLYTTGETEYPLIEGGITTKKALEMCYDYGFDFGGIYDHHQHFNCWLCPLQSVGELEWLWNNEPQKWEILREMQRQTDGSYYPHKSVFGFDEQFRKKTHKRLEQQRMDAREKYNMRSSKNNESK